MQSSVLAPPASFKIGPNPRNPGTFGKDFGAALVLLVPALAGLGVDHNGTQDQQDQTQTIVQRPAQARAALEASGPQGQNGSP